MSLQTQERHTVAAGNTASYKMDAWRWSQPQNGQWVTIESVPFTDYNQFLTV